MLVISKKTNGYVLYCFETGEEYLFLFNQEKELIDKVRKLLDNMNKNNKKFKESA